MIPMPDRLSRLAYVAGRCLLLFAGLLLAACADGAAVDTTERSYTVAYRATLRPDTGMAEVEIEVAQERDVLRTLDLNAPASIYTGFEGNGPVEISDGRVLWSVPASGGVLRFQATVDHLRGNVHDARMTDTWAVFRLGDIFPAARTVALKNSDADATLNLEGPQGWRFETPYGPSNKAVHAVSRNRLFPRPVGWAVGGDIGVRRDRIADRRVAVAAPVDQGFRRQDILAFLRWTLPTLVKVFPGFTERLLIVGGGQDMWRGGLSGPASLYLHPDRPLISGNGTSTLLHELIHIAVTDTSGEPDDWLVEGIAEYYSLEVLRRTSGISQRRFEGALAQLEEWAEDEDGHLTSPSTGADTAFAVLMLHDLAATLERKGLSLDALVQELLDRGLNAEALRAGLASLEVDVDLPLPDPPDLGVAE